jgi:predicted AlkP superfamily phosphohydrolase/phosphomutase
LSPLSPALVIGLDGATFDVIRPLVSEGKLPNLARLMREGSSAELASTVPPVTFPAWSAFLTGLAPGRHGIFDFTQKVEGRYRVRFVNASDRAGDSLFRQVTNEGGSVLALGIPATFPPEPVRGLLVSGFDAPVSAGTDSSSASDPALYDRIAAKAGPWMRPEINESAAEADFHERAVGSLLSRIERKTQFALEGLKQLREGGKRGPDLFAIVFSESDTVGHHYWRDHDRASPRHDPSASAARKGAITAVYEKLDQACGQLRAAFGESERCMVISDHGMGAASDRIVHLGRYLEECGLTTRKQASFAAGPLAKAARDTALRHLPPGVAQFIFRRTRGAAAQVESAVRFGGFDWTRTQAFSEEANTQPGVWLNVAGREASGCVAAGDYERVRDDVIEALLDWKLSGNDRVVARARRREEAYEGPFTSRAPDVVVELALDEGRGLSLVPTPWSDGERTSVRRLSGEELAGGRGRGMNGTHRPDGIFIAAGFETETATADAKLALVDVAPTVLESMGAGPLSHEPDGRARGEGRREYTAEEERVVAARLRAMGYLE